MPKMYIISGCNGAGKTTASYTILPELLECREFVNSDEFAKSLSPFDPSQASIAASRYMLQKIYYLLEHKQDFCVETTLATRSLVGIIQKARAAGYTVTTLYFWLNAPELAISRVRARVEAGGHNIPEDVIRRRYYMGLQYFFNTYIPISDRWVLADNSKTPFVTVAEGIGKITYIKDNELFHTIRSLVITDEQS